MGPFRGLFLMILFSFAGIFVSESKGAFLAIFKILIVSFVLCVKARYAFCHVFVFFWGPEKGPFEKRCISLTGVTFWPAGPSREHFASKGRLAHFRARSKSH